MQATAEHIREPAGRAREHLPGGSAPPPSAHRRRQVHPPSQAASRARRAPGHLVSESLPRWVVGALYVGGAAARRLAPMASRLTLGAARSDRRAQLEQSSTDARLVENRLQQHLRGPFCPPPPSAHDAESRPGRAAANRRQ